MSLDKIAEKPDEGGEPPGSITFFVESCLEKKCCMKKLSPAFSASVHFTAGFACQAVSF